MSQILSVIFMISNMLLFSSMTHPMSMGITLLTQTIMMCIMMGMMSYSSWFSYILFLVFLGGMLILFIYMTSIASNEMFNPPMYNVAAIIIMMMLFMMMFMLSDPFMIVLPTTESFHIMDHSLKMIMTPLYSNPMSLITIFMVLYLFLTLIVIVALTKFNKGPLRPMN
uniref:NADH-ubiquinone oxidoreductase chain 6 n=1 Tax=Orthetrum sabina TaxID=320892 RepID=A0A4Y5SFK9_9ODON|nr:NADH dehydrogenase subunit 6 [Orthetrum sabina]